MDPNAALKILREACADWESAKDLMTANDAAGDVVTYFLSLDSWLSSGGFPPEAWREGSDMPVDYTRDYTLDRPEM